MEYISAEEFLKQPKEVQEVFLKWWEPSVGDLYCIKQRVNLFDDTTQPILQTVSFNYDEASKNLMLGFNFIAPLFTEGQLRKFIEDNTGYTIDLCYYEGTYDIELCENDNGLCVEVIREVGKNLLQAYWKVACEVANSEVE